MPPNRSLNDLLNVERSNEHINEWNDTKKLISIYGIASGMSYLHHYNVIHRNLSPESIFLDDYLFPKIGNFGLLTKIHTTVSMTFLSTIGIKGNPSYSSPELLECNEYSKKSDVYAFAFIVYEIMTLEIPFNKINNFNKLFNEVVTLSHRPNIDTNIPECYQQLIELCWSQNPDDRPTFDEIISILKNDKRFITKNVNEEEFNKFVEFIEKTKIDFYSKNRVVKFDDIIKRKIRKAKEKLKSKFKPKVKRAEIIDDNNTKIKSKSRSKIDDDDDNDTKIKLGPKQKSDDNELIKSVSKSVNSTRNKRKNVINEFDHIYDDLLNKKFIGSIGKEVNDYLLQNYESISSSSISKEYKVLIGKSKSDKDFISIKLYHKEIVDNKKIEKLNSQYKIINNLNHPNIVKSLGFFLGGDVDQPSILFEYYSRKLKNVIESIEDVYLITLIFEIAHAMMIAHSNHLIHRHLNIENIFVDFENHAKIADFGNPILIDASNQIKNSNERLCCLSQELLKNQKYSEKVDVFAFGMIMKFILRRGKGSYLQKEEIIEGKKQKIPKEINKVSYSIIKLCLSHSEKERPSFKAIISTIKKHKFNLIDNIETKIPLIENHLKTIINKNHA